MNLQQIRNQFLSLSGRSDLNGDGEEWGLPSGSKKADLFIQMGTRYLDVMQRTEWSVAVFRMDITAGSYRLLVPEPRVICKVLAQSREDSIVELEGLTYDSFRSRYKKSLSSLDPGTPRHYTRAPHMPAPQQLKLATEVPSPNPEGYILYTDQYTYEFGDLVLVDESTPGSVGRYRAASLLIAPPSDVLTTISVVGEFYSNVLTSSSEENYWSVQFPELLVMASLRQLEAFYRNTEGMRDWEYAMAPILLGIEKDLAQQESTNVTRMEG